MEIFGHDRTITTLSQIVASQRIAPAYLFVGIDGIGKSLVARYFAELLLVSTRLENHPDMLWVQPTYQHQGKLYTAEEAIALGINRKSPPTIKIEQIRSVIDFLNTNAINSQRKVVVIESVGAIAEAGANALLKTLEEPGKATIILIASSVESILPTLASRCHRMPFYPLSRDNLVKAITQAGYADIASDDTILTMAAGSPGSAIAYHTQLKSLPNQLLQDLINLPVDPYKLLTLAALISSKLALESQFRLMDFLQHKYWQSHVSISAVSYLEQSKNYLNFHAQPRLVWECLLLNLTNTLLLGK
jgi:DNA polymerase-3 subunit delta'